MDEFLAGTETRALRIARFATRALDEALDLVQEAMLRLFRDYRGKPSDQWAPLFYRILQSRIRDWQRRRMVRDRWRKLWTGGAGEPGTGTDSRPTAAASAADALSANRMLDRLLDTVDRLPVRQQQVFLLRVWEGLDVAQTAFAMRCSQGSVKTHLSRAMSRVRDAIGDSS